MTRDMLEYCESFISKANSLKIMISNLQSDVSNTGLMNQEKSFFIESKGYVKLD